MLTSLARQRGEDAPLLHRVHVGDRHDEEQHQLAIVEDHVLGGGFERGTLAMRGVDDAEQRPDEARRQHDGFRLAQLNDFLDGHESVGDEEDQERQIADGMLRQVDARRRLLGMKRRGSGQEQGKYRNRHHRQPSGKTQHSSPPVDECRTPLSPATLWGTQGRRSRRPATTLSPTALLHKSRLWIDARLGILPTGLWRILPTRLRRE